MSDSFYSANAASVRVRAFTILRTDGVSYSETPVKVGDTVYAGSDHYGCASDDSRITGVEHGAFSLDPSGVPFFTMPRKDVVAKATGAA